MFLPRLLLSCFLLSSLSASAQADPDEAAYPALKRFVEVLETARERHPDLDKVSYDRLINQALDGMLSSLDPHSSFIHPEMQPFMDDSGSLNNEIPSLGLSLGKDSEGIFISAIEKHGPADKAGIIAGTEIISVNSVPQDTLDSTEVVNLFSGPAGSQITLTLRNPERPGELNYTLTRRFVEDRSLIEAVLLEKHPETGYLRLASFGANCAREIEAALDELEDNGMKSLILDLRGNGGGDLHETVSILGLFVPPSTKVVSVREREKPEEFLETPERQRRSRDYPIVVLIDRNSASASELTAGSLADLTRATIIGEKSYGKGSVQNIVPMGGGTALRLTIATYHTPSGNTPHLQGITPDVKIDFTEEDRDFFAQAGHPASFTDEERSAIEAWTDPAIQAAIESFKH
ncbi:MAG: S41 family peptidase [Luteolibacter sp.]